MIAQRQQYCRYIRAGGLAKLDMSGGTTLLMQILQEA